MIACQKANCKTDFQIEFLYKIYDAAGILSWKNSKGYVVQIEIWQEKKGLWHTVNNSRESAMSKVHMQYVISIVYKALPFLLSINKAVWKVCLVHWFCYTSQWNILTYKMMLCPYVYPYCASSAMQQDAWTVFSSAREHPLTSSNPQLCYCHWDLWTFCLFLSTQSFTSSDKRVNPFEYVCVCVSKIAGTGAFRT